MGFWDRFEGVFSSYDAAQRVLPDPYEPYMATRGIPVMDPGTPLEYLYRAEVERFWREQPNVRKVVDFIARSVASIPLHTFERVSDDERRRVTMHPLPTLLGAPRPGVGPFRFWHAVLSDSLLYDKFCVIKAPTNAGMELIHVPSWRLNFKVDELRRVVAIRYWIGDQLALRNDDQREQWVDIPLEAAVYDYGYAPASAGLSPLHTLSTVLKETSDAIAYRDKVWANGPRVPAYVHRPHEAPEWDEGARTRFMTGLRDYRMNQSRAGGWPLFEDGMELRTVDLVTSKDMLDLEGRKLAGEEVATSYHIAPELIGIRPGNFSNLRELRQTLYRDALGPYIDAWTQAINTQLVPDLAGTRRLYVDPHLDAKLRGSFEEQATTATTLVGAPVMTRNEYRARNNMPPIEGGDELVTPMNVTEGGLANPRDTGEQNRVPGGPEREEPKAAPRSKATPADSDLDKHARVVKRFFERQGRDVLKRIEAGDAEWWDGERWDGELADVLLSLHLTTSSAAGRAELSRLGLDTDEYDEPRTIAFLREAARLSAGSINASTQESVAAARDDEDADPATVFENEGRPAEIAMTVATFAAGFGTVEAVRQRGGGGATKTWRVNSSNPRASHKRLNGETVDLDDDFSNGLPWPGAMGSDADESAGCRCSIEINLP